jgi:thiamine-monophosphate kinase
VHARPESDSLEIIARVLDQSPVDDAVGIGDDAAVIGPELSNGERVVVSTDTLVDGVHFGRAYCSLQDIGWKALVSSLSDLAAMGARPIGATVALTGAMRDDLTDLYEGLRFASRTSACPIVGGDLSSGDQLTITVTVIGQAPNPVVRSGAREGHVVAVTGPLGGSNAGLRLLLDDPLADDRVARRHRRPPIRLVHGALLASVGVSAMIDVSDGLFCDADRLASASGVGLRLDTVPVQDGATLADACTGGEDYELLFTCDRPVFAAIGDLFEGRGLDIPTIVGECTDDASQRDIDGKPFRVAFPDGLGYQHRLG